MSKTKMSPGDWKIDVVEGETFIVGNDNQSIAVMSEWDVDAIEPNARAIVEVPEMIKALKDYREVLEVCAEFPARKKRVDELLSRIEGHNE